MPIKTFDMSDTCFKVGVLNTANTTFTIVARCFNSIDANKFAAMASRDYMPPVVVLDENNIILAYYENGKLTNTPERFKD